MAANICPSVRPPQKRGPSILRQMSGVERSGQRGLGRASRADTLGHLIDSAVTPVNYSSRRVESSRTPINAIIQYAVFVT